MRNEKIDTSLLKQLRGKFLILIAEDNQVNLKMMLILLQEAGYRTVSVFNGEEAVKCIRNENIDLVLMDIHMPTMDGFKATREIRGLEFPFNKVPIVAITAHALSGDKEKCLEAGMNDYISKPFNPQNLIQKLDNLLGIGIAVSEHAHTYVSSDVLDHDNLEKISLGNREFLQDLLITYIEDMEIRLKNLSDAFKEKNTKKIILESHSIKGASLSIGTNKVGEEARIIELSGKSDDLDAAENNYDALVEAFAEAKKHILDYLD